MMLRVFWLWLLAGLAALWYLVRHCRDLRWRKARLRAGWCNCVGCGARINASVTPGVLRGRTEGVRWVRCQACRKDWS